MLSFLFSSCCGLRQRPQEPPQIPHERTPLIPTSDDTPTPQPRVIDQQKLKERLGTVVRSKEGKMVNVNAQFPFNLHNQDVQEHSSSRSSRNVSGGTYASSRGASPSPRRSSLHKSPSTTSFRPDHEDLATSQHLPLSGNRSAPILNVRLVKPGRPLAPRRGRPTHTHDQNNRTQLPDSEIIPTASDSRLPQTEGDDEERTPHAYPLPLALGEHSSMDVLSNVSTPPHSEDFTIRDAGAVARSWGD